MNTSTKFGLAAALLGSSLAACAASGPSTAITPYLLPQAGVGFTSILTVGDTVQLKHKGNQSYRMSASRTAWACSTTATAPSPC